MTYRLAVRTAWVIRALALASFVGFVGTEAFGFGIGIIVTFIPAALFHPEWMLDRTA